MTGPQALSAVDALVGTCRASIVVTGITWIAQGRFAFAGVALVSLALTALPVRTLTHKALREAVSAVTAVLLAAHVVLGMGLGLYETSTVYDKVIHVLGFGAITVLLVLSVEIYARRHALILPTGLTACLVLSGTISAGAAWELFEFSVDLTGWFVAQRGLADTMLDLAADALGGLLVVGAFLTARSMDEAVLARG